MKMKMKIKCSWGTIYQQAATGKICVSPHELGEVGRYIYPEDFVETDQGWALKVDKSKMIEIEPVYENEIKIKCRCDWAKVDVNVAALSLFIEKTGIFRLPDDFIELDDNEWALRENPNKKIKIKIEQS